jgi:hypothetical protein
MRKEKSRNLINVKEIKRKEKQSIAKEIDKIHDEKIKKILERIINLISIK